VVWLWLFTTFIKRNQQSHNLLLAHFLDKTGIIDGIETDRTYVTQCSANTINSKDKSQWQQLTFFRSFYWQETRQENNHVSLSKTPAPIG